MKFLFTPGIAEYTASLSLQVFLLSIGGLLLIRLLGRESPFSRSLIASVFFSCLAIILLLTTIFNYKGIAFFKIDIGRLAEEYDLIFLMNCFGILWVTGTVLMLIRLLFSLSFLKGFKTATAHSLSPEYSKILEEVAADFDFAEVPKVFSSYAVESPITVGIKQISVIIPAHLLPAMSDDEFRSVLYHEFAHIYHKDHIFEVFMQVIIAFNWWNPLVYKIAKDHMIAREEISDDYAIRGIKSAKIYAESLLNLAEKVCLISKLPATAGMSGKGFNLKQRINNILTKEGKMTTQGSGGGQTIAVIALVITSICIAGTGFAFAGNPNSNSVVKSNVKLQKENIDNKAISDNSVQNRDRGATVEEKIVVAVNPLSAPGELEKEKEIISDVMQAELSVSDNITLVDRQNLQQALKELQLAQQGMLSPESAKKLGKIVGAKYFCSGKITKSGNKTMAIVKIIDVETTVTKLAYQTLQSKEDAVESGKALAENIKKLIANYTDEQKALSKKIAEENSRKKIPAEWERPVVMVIIPEMHIRQRILIDPAAETELVKRLIEDKFKVLNSEYATLAHSDPDSAARIANNRLTASEFAASKGADILIYGEAISELGARLGEFEGCRARVEVKAINLKTGEIILSDSAYGGATDLAETTAGKKALQKAANKLADTFLYDLAEKWNNR